MLTDLHLVSKMISCPFFIGQYNLGIDYDNNILLRTYSNLRYLCTLYDNNILLCTYSNLRYLCTGALRLSAFSGVLRLSANLSYV